MTPQDISHIAKLARLKLTEEEFMTFGPQLESILAYMEKLQELDTEGVPELAHAAGLTNQFREDVAVPSQESVHDQLMESFPQRQGTLLEVQAVFSNRNEE